LGVVAALPGLYFWAFSKYKIVGWIARRLAVHASRIGAGAKFKQLVAFSQIFNALGAVYGVQLHPDFKSYYSFLSIFNFDVVDLVLPGKCVGSLGRRIAVTALLPFGITLCAVSMIMAVQMVRHIKMGATVSGTRIWGQSLYATILILFLVLPSVSRYIFLARQCESFEYNDSFGESRSYLLADLDVRCSAQDPEFKRLNLFFWIFFFLWPVLVPLVYLVLVLLIRRTVVEKHSTALSNACKFLWADYNPDFLFWEVVDVMRKVLLSALILFMDTEQGSNRIMRLVIATIISAMYLGILALARPFKRTDDLYLACLANLLLTCCFISGKSTQSSFSQCMT
jgi:hypothetical protein